MLGGDQNSSLSVCFTFVFLNSSQVFQRTLSAVICACSRHVPLPPSPPPPHCLFKPTLPVNACFILFLFVLFCINYFGAKLPIKSKFSCFILPTSRPWAPVLTSTLVAPSIPFPLGLLCSSAERGGLGRDRATFSLQLSHARGAGSGLHPHPFLVQFFSLLFQQHLSASTPVSQGLISPHPGSPLAGLLLWGCHGDRVTAMALLWWLRSPCSPLLGIVFAIR